MLGKDQIEFIEKNVKKLGTLEAVKALYNKDCAVDDYANKIAKKILNKKKG